MAGPKAPPTISATPRELRRQAGVPPAIPTPAIVNAAPRIRPSAPSQRDYGKNPGVLNPANLGIGGR
jgi:hypothetical protein